MFRLPDIHHLYYVKPANTVNGKLVTDSRSCLFGGGMFLQWRVIDYEIEERLSLLFLSDHLRQLFFLLGLECYALPLDRTNHNALYKVFLNKGINNHNRQTGYNDQ